MRATITTEYESTFTETRLEDLLDFLCNIAEIANSSDDFVRKITHGVTDETDRLSREDESTLTQWYLNDYPKIAAA